MKYSYQSKTSTTSLSANTNGASLLIPENQLEGTGEIRVPLGTLASSSEASSMLISGASPAAVISPWVGAGIPDDVIENYSAIIEIKIFPESTVKSSAVAMSGIQLSGIDPGQCHWGVGYIRSGSATKTWTWTPAEEYLPLVRFDSSFLGPEMSSGLPSRFYSSMPNISVGAISEIPPAVDAIGFRIGFTDVKDSGQVQDDWSTSSITIGELWSGELLVIPVEKRSESIGPSGAGSVPLVYSIGNGATADSNFSPRIASLKTVSGNHQVTAQIIAPLLFEGGGITSRGYFMGTPHSPWMGPLKSFPAIASPESSAQIIGSYDSAMGVKFTESP